MLFIRQPRFLEQQESQPALESQQASSTQQQQQAPERGFAPTTCTNLIPCLHHGSHHRLHHAAAAAGGPGISSSTSSAPVHSTAQPTGIAFPWSDTAAPFGLVCPVAPSTSPPSSPTISRHVVSQTHRRGPSSTALMYAAQPNGADSATINPAALNTGTSLAPPLLFLGMAAMRRGCVGVAFPPPRRRPRPSQSQSQACNLGCAPWVWRCARPQSQISAFAAVFSSHQSALHDRPLHRRVPMPVHPFHPPSSCRRILFPVDRAAPSPPPPPPPLSSLSAPPCPRQQQRDG